MTFTTMRMETLKAERNAMRDDVESQRTGSADPDDGANDAEPTMMSFFNGKPYAVGLAAYNEYLASKG